MKIPPFQIESFIQKIASDKIAGCLVFGPEINSVSYRFETIAKKITPDLSDVFLVANLSKERLAQDKGVLIDEFSAMSMLGGRRLIIVRDGDSACANALKLLFEDENFYKKSENFILIQAGDLDKSSALRKACEDNPHFAAIACYEDNDSVIKNYIADELRRRKLTFTPQVVEMFLDKFGKDRNLIILEMRKMILFMDGNRNLTPEIVERLSGSESEISISEFVNSFAAQKFEDALLAAEKLFREGNDAITILRFLSNYFQKLSAARLEIESGNSDFDSAVKNQRLFFKAETDFRKHLKQLSQKFLLKILRDLEQLEIKIKSSGSAPKLDFIEFVQGFLRAK
jgi:DNA polymerase-3 subunit delta